MKAGWVAVLVGVLLPVFGVTDARAQWVGGFEARAKTKEYVVFDAEPQVVRAGKKSVLELRFMVRAGFHVNSHTPSSELLIPTRLGLEASKDVAVGAPSYPVGSVYRLPADPAEALDVYTGAFIVRVPVVAAAGEHAVQGTLRYQACDEAACYPPKTLVVRVPFTAR